MAVFQLVDGAAAQAVPHVLGVWETARPEVSFAAPGAETPAADVPVWSVNLPGDLRQARADLDDSLAQVEASREALTAARTRLDALIARAHSASAVSFAIASTEAELAAPERELLKRLSAITAEVAGAPSPGEGADVSFGLLGLPSQDDLRAAGEELRAVMERIARSLLYYALVETRIEGRLLGRTAVTWSAEARTLWQARAGREVFDLHRRSLELAVESRNALVRMFMLTAQGAVRLSVLLAMPGGPLLALPAAWKFVSQILAEARRFRQSHSQT